MSKKTTLQIVVTEEEKKKVEKIIRKRAYEDDKMYTISSFLSQSLLDFINEKEVK